MDEKEVREAIEYNKDFIEHLKVQIECLQKKDSNKFLITTYQEQIDRCEVVLEALEKQLPMKVNAKEEYRDFHGRLLYYKGFCPNCGFIVQSNKNKCCSCCTQMLDWSEQS